GFFFQPTVALFFKLQSQLFAARFDQPPIDHDMNEVWLYVVEQSLVMGDDNNRPVFAPQRIHTLRYNSQRINVEPGIRFVEDGKLRLQYRHLENLVSLLLAAGEALVDGTLQ